MHLAPLGDDASTTAHHAAETFVGVMDVLQADAAMDGEVVHSLLALLDERVAEEFPRQVLGFPFHLLHRLIHGHGTYGHGAVADNPLTRLVDVFSRGKIHQRITAPLAAPDGLLHFILNGRGSGGITDVRIDFHQEACADNHRFGLRMIDVGG